jgi:hypothetical protein
MQHIGRQSVGRSMYCNDMKSLSNPTVPRRMAMALCVFGCLFATAANLNAQNREHEDGDKPPAPAAQAGADKGAGDKGGDKAQTRMRRHHCPSMHTRNNPSSSAAKHCITR